MKAAISTAYGPPEVLEIHERKTPTPKAGEVLIKVTTAIVTTADSMMRKGTPYYARLFLGLRRPKARIPGTGFAGVVVATGAGVRGFCAGDEVFGETGTRFGAHAEYICLPETGVLAHLPPGMCRETAATLTDGPLTVMNFLTRLSRVTAGQKVLVIGASGSLGSAAVQIARHFGAGVTAVCSGANADLVTSLGAGKVVDYQLEDFTQRPEKYHIIFDAVGKSSFSASRRVLTKDGVYLSPVLTMPLLAQMLWSAKFRRKQARFSATGLLPEAQLRALLAKVTDLFGEGAVTAVIDRSYPLKQIIDAHRYVDKGHKRGNVILTIA